MAENTNKNQGNQGNQANQDQKKGDQKPAMPQQRQPGQQGGQGQPVDRDRDADTGNKMGEPNQDREKQGNRGQGQGMNQGRDLGKDIDKNIDQDADLGDEEVEQDEDSRVTQRSPSQGQDRAGKTPDDRK